MIATLGTPVAGSFFLPVSWWRGSPWPERVVGCVAAGTAGVAWCGGPAVVPEKFIGRTALPLAKSKTAAVVLSGRPAASDEIPGDMPRERLGRLVR